MPSLVSNDVYCLISLVLFISSVTTRVKCGNCREIRLNPTHHKPHSHHQQSSTSNNMDRNRVPDDMNQVLQDPVDTSSKKSKKPPPKSWPPPRFKPLQLKNDPTYGKGQFPTDIPGTSACDVFSIFYIYAILQILTDNKNAYAAKQISLKKEEEATPHLRQWYPTSANELKAWIGIIIYMGVHREPSTRDYWNTRTEHGPLHTTITSWLGLVRFEQLNRHFMYQILKQSRYISFW